MDTRKKILVGLASLVIPLLAWSVSLLWGRDDVREALELQDQLFSLEEPLNGVKRRHIVLKLMRAADEMRPEELHDLMHQTHERIDQKRQDAITQFFQADENQRRDVLDADIQRMKLWKEIEAIQITDESLRLGRRFTYEETAGHVPNEAERLASEAYQKRLQARAREIEKERRKQAGRRLPGANRR